MKQAFRFPSLVALGLLAGCGFTHAAEPAFVMKQGRTYKADGAVVAF